MSSAARYRLTYTGGGNPAARRDTLVGAGNIVVQAECWLALVLPLSLLITTAAGALNVTMHLLDELFLDVLMWSTALRNKDLAWVALLSRYSEFLFNADTTGKLLDARCASVGEVKAQLVLAAAVMPDTEKELDLPHVIASTLTVPVAGSHHAWYNKMTAAKLIGDDSTTISAVRFRSAVAHSYTQADRHDADGLFQEVCGILLHYAATPQGSASSLSTALQSNVVKDFWRRTSPEVDGMEPFISYMGADGGIAEVQRRASSTVNGRFRPLLLAAWRITSNGSSIFSQLQACKLLFLKPLGGHEMLQLINVLALQAGIPGELTPSSFAALCSRIAKLIPLIDTAALRNGDNAVRAKAVGDLLVANKDKDELGVIDAETNASLHLSVTFRQLTLSLEALDKEPRDYSEIAVTLAKAAHAAGIIFLGGGRSPNKFFSKFNPAKLTANLDQALQLSLSAEMPAARRNDGTVFVKPGIAVILIKAQFHTLRIWPDLVVPLFLAKSNAAALEVFSSDDSTFWTDPQRLAVAMPIANLAFAFIGYTGRSAGDFASFFDGMQKRANRLLEVPRGHKYHPGLAAKLISIGALALAEAADALSLTLKATVETAARPPKFISQTKPFDKTNSQLTLFDSDFDSILETIRLDGYEETPDNPTPGRVGPSAPSPRKPLQLDKVGSKLPKTNVHDWTHDRGSYAEQFGVYKCEGFNGFIFGAAIYVEFGQPLSHKKHCLGSLCHYRVHLEDRRFRWCHMQCQNWVHHRPRGVPDDAGIYITLYHPADETELSIALAILAERNTWTLVAGDQTNGQCCQYPTSDVRSVMGGVSTAMFNDTSTIVSKESKPANDGGKGSKGNGKGGGGKGGDGGKGKGKGAKGNGKGNGKGKGKGKGFGRQAARW